MTTVFVDGRVRHRVARMFLTHVPFLFDLNCGYFTLRVVLDSYVEKSRRLLLVLLDERLRKATRVDGMARNIMGFPFFAHAVQMNCVVDSILLLHLHDEAIALLVHLEVELSENAVRFLYLVAFSWRQILRRRRGQRFGRRRRF